MTRRSTADALGYFLDRAAPELLEAGRALVIRPQAHAVWSRFDSDRLDCVQSDKTHADALTRQGLRTQTGIDETKSYELAIVMADKHREENLFFLAKAAQALADDGVLVAVCANETGAATLQKRFDLLMGASESFSKRKCRVFWSRKGAHLDETVLSEWLELGDLRLVPELDLYSRPGLFSWNRIDDGSALLAEHLPASLPGVGADLGAGFGWLSREILRRAADVRALHLYEVERRALDAAQRNLAPFADKVDLEYHWRDVSAGLPARVFDWIVMNPPFHAGKQADAGLGQAFIRAAATGLKHGGVLYMVANRRLPYERVLTECFSRFDVLADDQGFKALRAKA